jgi:hypothetical protein
VEQKQLTSDDITFPQGIPRDKLLVAQQELETFTETTLTKLIDAEKLAYYHTPSTSLFCRLDIGVMPNAKGNLQYFVNEITRGPTMTCLFSKGLEVAPNLGADFAVIFHEYLSNNYNLETA